FRERIFLLEQTKQKKTNPIDEVRFVFVQRSLRTAQRAVVLFAIFLNDAFQRAVGHIAITGSQKRQIRQHSRKSSISVLKWMDRKKPHDERADHEQRVVLVSRELTHCPTDQFLHQAWRVKRTRRFENNAHTAAVLVKRFHVVRQLFVLSTMTFVPRRMV